MREYKGRVILAEILKVNAEKRFEFVRWSQAAAAISADRNPWSRR
jgi:hypothetical protein